MTSPIETVEIECPRCGTIYRDWYRASINLRLSPDLGDPEYLRQASTATCPDCGFEVAFETLLADRTSFEFYTPEHDSPPDERRRKP